MPCDAPSSLGFCLNALFDVNGIHSSSSDVGASITGVCVTVMESLVNEVRGQRSEVRGQRSARSELGALTSELVCFCRHLTSFARRYHLELLGISLRELLVFLQLAFSDVALDGLPLGAEPLVPLAGDLPGQVAVPEAEGERQAEGDGAE